MTRQPSYCLILLSAIVQIFSASAESKQDGSLLLHTNLTEAASFAAGYLLADATDKQLDLADGVDATLASVLQRNGPDMRPLRDFRDFDDITLEVAKRAWKLMRRHAQRAAKSRLSALQPLVLQSLVEANVSDQCYKAALSTISSAQNLDSWAIQRELLCFPNCVLPPFPIA